MCVTDAPPIAEKLTNHAIHSHPPPRTGFGKQRFGCTHSQVRMEARLEAEMEARWKGGHHETGT